LSPLSPSGFLGVDVGVCNSFGLVSGRWAHGAKT